MLECDFCGCYSPNPGKGWAAYHPEDADGFDESGVRVYCPACANAWFGHRPEAAAKHVCIWKPPPDSRPKLDRTEGAG